MRGPGETPGASGDIRYFNADTTLTLSQPLLRGFGTAATRRALSGAELRREDSNRFQTLAEQQVAIDVASAYYRVVAQEASVDAARQSLTRARTLREAAAAKLDAGLVSQLDVLRAQQLVTQAEDQFFDAQSVVADVRDQLLFLMGRGHSHSPAYPAGSQDPGRQCRRCGATGALRPQHAAPG